MSWGRPRGDADDLPQREAGSTVSEEEQEKIRENRKDVQEGYNRQWESGW